MFLNRAVQIKDAKFQHLIDVLVNKLKPRELIEVFTDVRYGWNQADQDKQLPNEFDMSLNSAKTRPIMTRAVSRSLQKQYGMMQKIDSGTSKISANEYAVYNNL